MSRSTGSAMASASSAKSAGTACARDVGFAAARHDAKFQVFDQAAAEGPFEVAQDVRREREQLALPGVVLDFDDEAGAHQLRGAGMAGDLLADGFGPRGAGELFRRNDIAGQSQSPDELAGAFHVWQVLILSRRTGAGGRNGDLRSTERECTFCRLPRSVWVGACRRRRAEAGLRWGITKRSQLRRSGLL